jgi:hypothetical protein
MKIGRRAMIPLALLAAAVAILLYVGLGSRRAARHAALPEYDVPRLELRPGRDAPFEVAAVPATPVAMKVVAFAFAMGEGDAEPNPVDAKVEIAPDGAVRLKGRARALEGAREVRVVIGAAADFTRYEDALTTARAGTSNAQVRVLVVPVVRVARAPD